MSRLEWEEREREGIEREKERGGDVQRKGWEAEVM